MKSLKIGILVLLALPILSFIPSSADVLRVPHDYPTIAGACAVATVGDTVAVYEGTYICNHARIAPGVSVIGMGTAPDEVSVRSVDGYVFHAEVGVLPSRIENMMLSGEFCAIENHNPGLVVERCRLISMETGGYILAIAADCILRMCYIYYEPWGTYHMFIWGGPVNVLVEDCVIGGIAWTEWYGAPGSYFEFRNNTFDTWANIDVSGSMPTDFTVIFTNNIILGGAPCSDRVPDTVEWRYNDIMLENQWPDCGYQIGNFSADPMFCSGSYSIDWESPCRGAGENGEDVGARLGYCNQPAAGVDGGLWPSIRTSMMLGNPYPNPTAGTASFSLMGYGTDHAEASVYDISGQCVRRLLVPVPGSNQRTIIRWDGNLANGSPAPAGVYYVRVESGDQTASQRLIVVR